MASHASSEGRKYINIAVLLFSVEISVTEQLTGNLQLSLQNMRKLLSWVVENGSRHHGARAFA